MTDIEVNSQSTVQTIPASPSLPQKRPFEEVDGGRHAIDLVPGNNDNGLGGPNTSNESNVVEQDKSLPAETQTALTSQLEASPTQPTSRTDSTTSGPVNPSATSEAAMTSILSPIPAPNTTFQPQPTTPGAGSAPNKKRKLSPASKEARQQEKEAKERQRAEEKARKDEERRRKEEEKKKRDEEREEKRKLKEEERLAKEEEKRKKEAEKSKKERSQMRLNAFFTKPPASNSSSEKDTGNLSVPTSTSNEEDKTTNPTENATIEKKAVSDYSQQFPPFFVQSHMNVAPMHRFERDSDSLKHMHEKVDAILQNREESTADTEFRPADVFHLIPYKRQYGRNRHPTVKEILISIQDSASRPIDLTGDDKQDDDDTRNKRPEDFLKKIPMKLLKFQEDVRPPYQGTFTRRLPSPDAKRLCRNPFSRSIPDLNYDYDSEAEWEEPEEGEDLTSENEEEASDDGGEDMEGFLDDGDDELPNGKRRIIVGDLEPVSTGIRWEGEGEVDDLFKSHRMEVISDTLQFPIDPFSTSYWAKPAPTQPPRVQQLSHIPHHSSPLANGPNPGGLSKQFFGISQQATGSSVGGSSSGQRTDPDPSRLLAGQNVSSGQQQKPRRPFPPDQVAEFKNVVAGSDLTKAGLIEVLKKRFPKISKEVIKDTLSSTAVRLGQKEADKKWVLI